MKKFMTMLLCVNMVLACLLGGLPASEVYAASSLSKTKTISKAKAAKKAFAKALTSGKIEEDVSGELEFALIDINKDGVQEILVTGDGCYHTYIYAYVNKKVKQVDSNFAGGYTFYPNKDLIFAATYHSGLSDELYSKFDGKSVKNVTEKLGDDTYNAVTGKKKTKMSTPDCFAPYRYTVKGKTVTKKYFNAYVKKMTKGAKEVKPKYHKATKRNISKYLK